MEIIICPGRFKECLSSADAARQIEKGLKSSGLTAKICVLPLADGGRGTVDIILKNIPGRRVKLKVPGPIGKPVEAAYALIERGKTAVIEMSSASGLELLEPAKRNPLKTTSYGTGQLIKDALQNGCKKIVVGLGDSATVDGGVGMASALGVRFLNSKGKSIGPGGGELAKIKKADVSKMDRRVNGAKIIAACDVKNTLLGRWGAARVYGPQKGATPAMVKVLERGLANFARVIKKDTGRDVTRIPGGGAAGGLGAGLAAFLNAEIKSGFEITAEFLNLEKILAGCDIVITGEGKIDSQTFRGKTVAGVLKTAKKYDKPVICLAGTVEETFGAEGNVSFFSITPGAVSLKEALAGAPDNLFKTALNIGRLLKIKPF
ncbi:MAG: glycerate kinase [bacterium]